MVKGDVIISENLCQGCGYCEKFCERGCIEMPKEKFSPLGFSLPVFINPEECNTCGHCAMMCPHLAIEVYLIIEEEA